MKILYGEKKECVDSYTYTVNEGGDLVIKPSKAPDGDSVVIVFTNGKLSYVKHNASGHLRSDWHVNGAIAKRITEIEAMYASGVHKP